MFQNIFIQPKPFPSLKEICILETQASAQKHIGLLLALSAISGSRSEMERKLQHWI